MSKIAARMANSVDPDQTPRSVASDLGLPWFPSLTQSSLMCGFCSNFVISICIPDYESRLFPAGMKNLIDYRTSGI